jgi:hypothetical protein
MQNQTQFSIAVARVAEHLKRHSHTFAEDGPVHMSGEQRANHIRKIELCAERIAATRTYVEFETTLGEAHKLGAYPYNHDVSAVAFASLGAD